jgi:hypothetical protein
VLPVTASSADNVALPGIAMFFKIAEVSECNACSLKIDFMNRRGACSPPWRQTRRTRPWEWIGPLQQQRSFCRLQQLARLVKYRPGGLAVGDWCHCCGTLRRARPACRGPGEVAGRGRAAQRVGLQGAWRGLLRFRQEPGHYQGAPQPHAMSVSQPGRAAQVSSSQLWPPGSFMHTRDLHACSDCRMQPTT